MGIPEGEDRKEKEKQGFVIVFSVIFSFALGCFFWSFSGYGILNII